MNFGEYIKAKRIQEGLTLRAFCKKNNFDTAYISRLETGKLLPPFSVNKYSNLASALEITIDSPEWKTFTDLIAQAHQDLPDDIKKEVPELISTLPAFLRTYNNRKIDREKVKKLLDFLSQQPKK